MIPKDILNYRVLRLLGTGGMGSVYLAANTDIDQQVAIKALRLEVARNATLRAHFKQEAELLCSLDHPGIVKFLNYVELPEGVFLIMEYVKGVTLEDYINKKNGLIVEKKAYPLINEILDAFAYAHSKGIVHRDIKPSNIIIQPDGHIKVMDFGIAQIVSEASSDTSVTMGTPTYMSPEQVYGKDVNVRSDIYSLGVLIHNMLTGRAPYDSTTMTEQEIKRNIVREKLLRMADYYPYISNKIQKVVDKATQKVPEARYANCREMAKDVKKALAPDPISRPLFYGGIVALLVAAVGGFLAWDYFRIKTEYYKDYVEVYGVPQGIGSLSYNEAKHREASYKFEYSRHRLRRVSYVNCYDKLTYHHDTEDKEKLIDMTLTYTEGSGKVDAAKYMDRSGKVLYVKDYDSNFKTCTFKLDDELGTEMTLNSQVDIYQTMYDINNEGKSKISKFVLEYDDEGRLAKVEYAGFGNVRVPDGQGIFGRRYVYDEEGRLAEEHYLGKDGKPKATKFGLGIKRFTYDKEDNLTKVEYITIDGNPSSDGNNCPVVNLTYDEWGNRTSEKYTDTSGQAVVRKDYPFAGVVYERNEQGLPISETFVGLDGRPTFVNGACMRVIQYDANGYETRIAMTDAIRKPVFYYDNDAERTYSEMAMSNDEHGNQLDLQYLNTSGELIEDAAWVHRKCTYDSIGNQLSEYYYDREGSLYAPPSLGYAGITITYTPQGRMETITYMDANKKRTNLADIHLCYIKNEYDARGNFTRKSYYDNTDNLTKNNEGNAVTCYEYDDNGNETAMYFLDEKGTPCTLNYKCARYEYTYDEQGNITKVRFKDTDGKLMMVGGIAGMDYSYDERGNILTEYPIGTNEKLAADKHETHRVYDERDNVTEESYFGVNGKTAVCEEGFHKAKYAYDSRNLRTQAEYYDKDEQLINIKGQNYAVVKYEYDAKCNNTSLTYYRQDGTRGNDKNKVHKYFNQYDKVVNKVCHQISFGVDGTPIVTNGIAKEGRIEYDERGNIQKLICFDGNGERCNGEQGWCEKRYTYDEANMNTSIAYFTIDNQPLIDKENKYHKVVYTYNPMRLVESETYYGKDGKPINLDRGYSTTKTKYNNQNQRTEIAYFSNGKAVNNTGGWHRELYIFEKGAEKKCELYDAAGHKIGTAIRTGNNWDLKGVGQNSTDWKRGVKELAKSCPIDIGNGVYITQLQCSNNSLAFHLRLNNMEGNDINGDWVNENAARLKKEMAKSFGTPPNVRITVLLYNRYDELLVTL